MLNIGKKYTFLPDIKLMSKQSEVFSCKCTLCSHSKVLSHIWLSMRYEESWENWGVIQAVPVKELQSQFNWLVGSGWLVLLQMSPNSHNLAGPMLSGKKVITWLQSLYACSAGLIS